MPITEIDYSKRDAFVRANQANGVLENCIVHKTAACLARGAMYVRPATNTIMFGEPANAAHICADCAALLASDRADS